MSKRHDIHDVFNQAPGQDLTERKGEKHIPAGPTPDQAAAIRAAIIAAGTTGLPVVFMGGFPQPVSRASAAPQPAPQPNRTVGFLAQYIGDTRTKSLEDMRRVSPLLKSLKIAHNFAKESWRLRELNTDAVPQILESSLNEAGLSDDEAETQKHGLLAGIALFKKQMNTVETSYQERTQDFGKTVEAIITDHSLLRGLVFEANTKLDTILSPPHLKVKPAAIAAYAAAATRLLSSNAAVPQPFLNLRLIEATSLVTLAAKTSFLPDFSDDAPKTKGAHQDLVFPTESSRMVLPQQHLDTIGSQPSGKLSPCERKAFKNMANAQACEFFSGALVADAAALAIKEVHVAQGTLHMTTLNPSLGLADLDRGEAVAFLQRQANDENNPWLPAERRAELGAIAQAYQDYTRSLGIDVTIAALISPVARETAKVSMLFNRGKYEQVLDIANTAVKDAAPFLSHENSEIQQVAMSLCVQLHDLSMHSCVKKNNMMIAAGKSRLHPAATKAQTAARTHAIELCKYLGPMFHANNLGNVSEMALFTAATVLISASHKAPPVSDIIRRRPGNKRSIGKHSETAPTAAIMPALTPGEMRLDPKTLDPNAVVALSQLISFCDKTQRQFIVANDGEQEVSISVQQLRDNRDRMAQALNIEVSQQEIDQKIHEQRVEEAQQRSNAAYTTLETELLAEEQAFAIKREKAQAEIEARKAKLLARLQPQKPTLPTIDEKEVETSTSPRQPTKVEAKPDHILAYEQAGRITKTDEESYAAMWDRKREAYRKASASAVAADDHFYGVAALVEVAETYRLQAEESVVSTQHTKRVYEKLQEILHIGTNDQPKRLLAVNERAFLETIVNANTPEKHDAIAEYLATSDERPDQKFHHVMKHMGGWKLPKKQEAENTIRCCREADKVFDNEIQPLLASIMPTKKQHNNGQDDVSHVERLTQENLFLKAQNVVLLTQKAHAEFAADVKDSISKQSTVLSNSYQTAQQQTPDIFLTGRMSIATLMREDYSRANERLKETAKKQRKAKKPEQITDRTNTNGLLTPQQVAQGGRG